MNKEQITVFISVLLLIIITIITLLLLMTKHRDSPFYLEGFLGCKTDNTSKLNMNRVAYNNMDNRGRITELKRGPIPMFHQQFTGGIIPELLWRSDIEKNINDLSSVNGLKGDIIQPINPINNVYSNVNY
jgi:hypothetical protein